MTLTMNYTGTLVVQECYRCHIAFAIPRDLDERALSDHSINFYCPIGHGQHYIGQTNEAKLKAQLDQMQADRDNARRQRNIANMERERVERSNAALRGHLTRYRKRIANGVCPVAGCTRSGFHDVERHIASKHPQWLAEHPEVFDA